MKPFDHSKTRFALVAASKEVACAKSHVPLTGAHRALQCQARHKTSTSAATKTRAPSTRYACHSPNNVQDGAFGWACEKCHTTVSFRQGLARQ